MQKLLTQLGLEESVAKVYLALLELGPSTVTEITRKAGITRTLGYHVLEKLGWQGLVDRVSGSGKKIRFIATHPRHLVEYVKGKQKSWERKLSELQNNLPDILALYKVAEKPVVRYQEGAGGIKNIFSETLESTTEIISILDVEGWDTPEFRRFGKEYNEERSRRKIKERILFLDTTPGREWMKYYQGSKKYTNYRWIKQELLPGIMDFGGELNVFENKVVMALFKPHKIGILIESTALANILKALFEMAWISSGSGNRNVHK